MHHVPQRLGEPIFLPRKFGLGWLAMLVPGLITDMKEAWWYYTSLYIVGKFRIQCGIVRSPGRRFGCQIEREIQKGNDDRCAVCSSASDIRYQKRKKAEEDCFSLSAGGCSSPHVNLSASSHLKAAVWLFEGAKPLPEGTPVNNLIDAFPANEGQSQDDCIRGSQVG